MSKRGLALQVLGLVLALTLFGPAAAEPVTVASGAYPEGLMWHGGRPYFAEMGADRVSIVEESGTREFWRMPGCGPTQIVPVGPSGFIVDCHLGRAMVEVSASGATGRRFATAPNGERLQDPNAAASDGQGGVYFSDAGVFDLFAPATGRVYHLSAMGVMTELASQFRYANGVNFDPSSRTLYVSEHLARRVLALTLDARHRVITRRVLVDFSQLAATRSYSYPLAGPDGIALRPGLIAVAEYGEGRVHIFDREGAYRRTLKVPMPFVDTVIWDDAGNLFAGGAFQNRQPPFEGPVVRFSAKEWQHQP
jgi:sugar lactone lactonase YvrE